MIRILNFDDSIVSQKKLLARFDHTIVDFKMIGPQSRFWLNKKEADEIQASLDPSQRHLVTFLGSGDFHQVSSLLISQFEEPISVIVFDHHPDWDILPPKLHCGSWVTETLKQKNVKKMILLGVSSHDISTLGIQTGNLSSLKDDRVEIYPYFHKPTRTFRRVPENKSIRVSQGLLSTQIEWQEIRNENIGKFFSKILQRMESKRVYVSIDKDCLKAKYSLTNWEEGFFELEELLMFLKLIKKNLEIVGLDIVGDYSVPGVKGWIKRTLSALDHPKDFSAKRKAKELIREVNEQTNIRILEALSERDEDYSENNQKSAKHSGPADGLF